MSDHHHGRRLFTPIVTSYAHSSPVPYTQISAPRSQGAGPALQQAWIKYDSLAARLYFNTLSTILYPRLLSSSFHRLRLASSLRGSQLAHLVECARIRRLYALRISFRAWEAETEFFDDSSLLMERFGGGGAIEEGDASSSELDGGGSEEDEGDGRERRLYMALKMFVRLSKQRDLLKAFRTLKYNDGVRFGAGDEPFRGEGGREPYPHEIWSRKRDQDFNFFLPQQVRS